MSAQKVDKVTVIKKNKKFVQYLWCKLLDINSGQLFVTEKDEKEMYDSRELSKNRDGKHTNTTESKIKHGTQQEFV